MMIRDDTMPHIANFVCGNDACSSPNWWQCMICDTSAMTERPVLMRHSKSKAHKAAVNSLQTPPSVVDDNELRFRESDVPDSDLNDEMEVENDTEMEFEMGSPGGDITDETTEYVETAEYDDDVVMSNNDDGDGDVVSECDALVADDHQNDTIDIDDDVSMADENAFPSSNYTSNIHTIKDWKKMFLEASSPPINFQGLIHDGHEKAPARANGRTIPNVSYYERQHRNRNGPSSLVSNALYGFASDEFSDRLPEENCLFSVMLAMLANRLTVQENTMLVSMLQYLFYHASSQQLTSTSLPLHVPRVLSQLRKYYLDGRRSIRQLLPRPSIISLQNGIVYMPIRESIQFLLAHGHPFEPLLNLSLTARHRRPLVHGSTERGAELAVASHGVDEDGHDAISESITCGLPAAVYTFRDGFDPGNVKKNRGSAEAIYFTIALPQSSCHTGVNTFLVALGQEGADFSVVEEMIRDELIELSRASKFYDGDSRKVISLYAHVYAMLEDRPQRSKSTRMSAGNSTYMNRPGHAGDLREVQDFLPSCPDCYSRLVSNLPGTAACNNCANWNFARLDFKKPTDYPDLVPASDHPELVPASDRTDTNSLMTPPLKLPFRKVDFKTWKEAILCTHSMIVGRHQSGKTWTPNKGFRYLKVLGLSDAHVADVVNHAKSCRDQIAAQFSDSDSCDSDGPGLDWLLNLADPEFDALVSPATWDIPLVELRDFIGVLMHLAFLGVTKANAKEIIPGYLKSKRKWTSFKDFKKGPLKSIQVLSLAWCKALVEPGSYVSEQWIAYARLSKWLHGGMGLLVATDVVYEDPPGVEFERHTAKQKKAWLSSRNIPFTKSWNLDKINPLFEKWTSLPLNEIPPIDVPIESDATTETMEDIVIAWVAALGRIMVRGKITEDEAAEIDRHVKIFLTTVDRYDASKRRKGVKPKEKEAIWKRKYNYISLLNLAEDIRRYGGLRQLWEGSFMGEGSLQLLKRHINQGLKGNWAFNTAQKYWEDKAFREVVKDCAANLLSDENKTFADLPIPVQQMVQTVKDIGIEHSDGVVDASLEDDDESVEMEDVDDELLDEENGLFTARRYKDHFVYPSEAKAVENFTNGLPVCGIVLQDGTFHLVAADGGGVKRLIAVVPGVHVTSRCGADYFRWSKYEHESEIPRLLSPNDDCRVVDYFLLLPLLLDVGLPYPRSFGREFYMITSTWKEGMKGLDDGSFSVEVPQMRKE
jgi:hypothetical protein